MKYQEHSHLQYGVPPNILSGGKDLNNNKFRKKKLKKCNTQHLGPISSTPQQDKNGNEEERDLAESFYRLYV